MSGSFTVKDGQYYRVVEWRRLEELTGEDECCPEYVDPHAEYYSEEAQDIAESKARKAPPARQDRPGGLGSYRVMCSACRGTGGGRRPYHCPSCNGVGTVEVPA